MSLYEWITSICAIVTAITAIITVLLPLVNKKE